MGFLHDLKNVIVPSGSAPHSILTWAFAGLKLCLDLQSQAQTWLGLYEQELYAPLRNLSWGIQTGIDIGCAQGEFTVYFLKRTDAVRVLAIDGNAQYLDILRRNVALNECDCSRLAIHHKYIDSLDSFRGEIELPCLVKIDIDGGEMNLLMNSLKLLALPQVRWIIEVHSPELEHDCLGILRLNGYRTIVLKNAWWRSLLGEQRPLELNRWVIAEQKD
jgi:precorrin-6B methylase 2